MKRIHPLEILTEWGKGRGSIDKEFFVGPLEGALKSPFLPLNSSRKNGQERKWRIDEEDAIRVAQSHHQKLLPLDYTIPSVHCKIDEFNWNFIHWIFAE
jgi:hypothetical protein